MRREEIEQLGAFVKSAQELLDGFPRLFADEEGNLFRYEGNQLEMLRPDQLQGLIKRLRTTARGLHKSLADEHLRQTRKGAES